MPLRPAHVLLATALAAHQVAAQPVEEVAERVAEAQNLLRDRFAEGDVRGRFLERLEGQYAFSPDARELPIADVVNPESVSAMAVGAHLEVAGSIDDEWRLIVQSYQVFDPLPDISPDPREVGNDVSAGLPGPRDVAGAVRGIVQGLDEALQPGAMNVETRSFDENTELGSLVLNNAEEIVAAYATADPVEQAQLARTWRELRYTLADVFTDETQYKAIYGQISNYPTWTYDRIFEQATSVVAIAPAGSNRSVCSGVLVTTDIVLTAGHCFEGPLQQYEVWFGYMQYPNLGQAPIVKRMLEAEPIAPAAGLWPDLLARNFSASLLDYAMVRIAPPSEGTLLPDVPALPGRNVSPRPQCLRKNNPQRGDALYVVGYPQARHATVHDNARVEFPFRILASGNNFDLLRLDVEADFVGTPEHAAILEEFDRSYLREPVPGSIFLSWRSFYDIRDRGQPRMGIVADTFRGNSGGPVFDRENEQCVVGILNKGMPDTGLRRSANWKVHERVLPVTAILQDLERHEFGAELLASGALEIR
ncbi:MAG: trypsin-like serine protease [Pseudomonadota bacterium]